MQGERAAAPARQMESLPTLRLSRQSVAIAIGLALLAAALLSTGLGEPRLWSDEADTAVFARTIVAEGLPRAWDGTTFTDSDGGRRLDRSLVMVGTPWLPFYLTAASFAVFGASTWAARLPFALAGLATVALLYLLVARVTLDRRAALVASLLTLLSVQFLLYARQCRHYALNMLLSVALVLAFLRLRDHPRDPWLVIVAVLLYYTHPLPAAAGLAALGGLTLVHPSFTPLRRAFLLRMPFVALFTLPWMALAWSNGWDMNSTLLTDPAEALPRLGQFVVEASVAIPVLAWLVLLPWLWRSFGPRDREWLALGGAHLAAYAVLTPLLIGTFHLWVVGLRYACALLPLGAGISGLLVARAARGTVACCGLVALLAFTHLGGNALPWLFLHEARLPEPTTVGVHVPRDGLGRVLRLEWVGFVRELREPERGSVSAIVDFLHRNAQPGDVVVTNYAWEPIYFHTGLPMGWRLTPASPIYAEAQRAGLPAYVFGADDARWVIWRKAWGAYSGVRFDEVKASLAQRGARMEPAARLRETLWENRPELHFHRFPRLGHLYPMDQGIAARDRYPDLLVFRVVPAAATGPGASEQ